MRHARDWRCCSYCCGWCWIKRCCSACCVIAVGGVGSWGWLSPASTAHKRILACRSSGTRGRVGNGRWRKQDGAVDSIRSSKSAEGEARGWCCFRRVWSKHRYAAGKCVGTNDWNSSCWYVGVGTWGLAPPASTACEIIFVRHNSSTGGREGTGKHRDCADGSTASDGICP